MTTQTSGLEVLGRDECVRLLAGDSVGRLAVLAAGAPHILPVNYVLDGECIVMRTDAGTKLSAAEAAPGAFEVDDFDRKHHTGWSVVAHGRLEELTRYDGPSLPHVAGLGVVPWAPGDKTHWMRLVPSYFTGRRLS